MPFPIQIDATALSCPNFVISDITGAIETQTLHAVLLEPGSYHIQTHAAADLSWVFTITPEGHVDYLAELDVDQGGFLSGRSSGTLVVTGFVIRLYGTSLATVNYNVANIAPWLPAKDAHTLHLLPRHYQFIQGNSAVPEADFSFTLDGTAFGITACNLSNVAAWLADTDRDPTIWPSGDCLLRYATEPESMREMGLLQ